SSSNRMAAAISDSVICIGLANRLAMPSSANARQISFRINRVAISIIATYSNRSISRNETAEIIQFITFLRGSVALGHSNATLWTQLSAAMWAVILPNPVAKALVRLPFV